MLKDQSITGQCFQQLEAVTPGLTNTAKKNYPNC